MKKIIIPLFCALILIAPVSAEAFTLFSKNNTQTAASTLTTSDIISQITNDLYNTDKNVQNSFSSIVSILSSKTEANRVLSKINSIKNSSADEIVKSAEIAQIMADYAKDLKNSKTNLKEKVKNLSNTQKTQLKNNLIAFAQQGTQYLETAKKFKNVASTIASSSQDAVTVAQDVVKLKNAAQTIYSNVQTVKSVTSQVTSIARSAGYKINI